MTEAEEKPPSDTPPPPLEGAAEEADDEAEEGMGDVLLVIFIAFVLFLILSWLGFIPDMLTPR